MSYVELPIWSHKNGHRSQTMQYSLQKLHDMVISCNEDNLQVTPLFNANRNDTKKISQQHSHFRSVCSRIALKKWHKRSLYLPEIVRNRLDCALLESAHPFCCCRVLSSSGILFVAPTIFSSLSRHYKMLQPLLTDSPSIPGLLLTSATSQLCQFC